MDQLQCRLGLSRGCWGVRASRRHPTIQPCSVPHRRLALERASSAAEAVDVITSLLEAHGQGGPCEEEGGCGLPAAGQQDLKNADWLPVPPAAAASPNAGMRMLC